MLFDVVFFIAKLFNGDPLQDVFFGIEVVTGFNQVFAIGWELLLLTLLKE